MTNRTHNRLAVVVGFMACVGAAACSGANAGDTTRGSEDALCTAGDTLCSGTISGGTGTIDGTGIVSPTPTTTASCPTNTAAMPEMVAIVNLSIASTKTEFTNALSGSLARASTGGVASRLSAAGRWVEKVASRYCAEATCSDFQAAFLDLYYRISHSSEPAMARCDGVYFKVPYKVGVDDAVRRAARPLIRYSQGKLVPPVTVGTIVYEFVDPTWAVGGTEGDIPNASRQFQGATPSENQWNDFGGAIQLSADPSSLPTFVVYRDTRKLTFYKTGDTAWFTVQYNGTSYGDHRAVITYAYNSSKALFQIQ